MSEQKQKTSVPWRENNLLPAVFFRSYCEEQGILVTPEDLKALQQDGLLEPAVVRDGEVLYDRYQHIVLKLLRNHITWHSDFGPPINEPTKELLREKIALHYRFLGFFLDVEAFEERWSNEMKNTFEREVKEIGEEDAREQWPLEFNSRILKKMKQEGALILQRHTLSVANVYWWRFMGAVYAVVSYVIPSLSRDEPR